MLPDSGDAVFAVATPECAAGHRQCQPVAPVAGDLDILARIRSLEQTRVMTLPNLGLDTVSIPQQTVRFTNTAVRQFDRSACWLRHQQVFDAIVKSNGWGDEMAALQLLAHLDREALDVALLTPEDRRATRSGLSGVLSEYYSSPGRLAVYWRKFECAVQRDEEDPSKFA